MVERATLRLDAGDEIRVEVERNELDQDEITVRRASANGDEPRGDLLAIVDELLARGVSHPAGTTDRLLAADRDRPY